MAVEISHDINNKFTAKEFTRASLLTIPYDSSYWNSFPILKTTPLEESIIRNLGGGQSLNRQFYLYKQYELNVTDGGINGEEKFNWFKEISKDKRILYLCFWDSNIKSYIRELEYAKQLYKTFGNKVAFVFISIENDAALWQQLVNKYNLFSDGIINYRITDSSQLAKFYKIKKTPSYVLISKDGSVSDLNAKAPNDSGLEKDFQNLINQIREP
jgi:hypothetical protein